MYNYVTGRVAAVNESYAVIENNGIGYEIYCSRRALKDLTPGSEAKLYTYLSVREDGITLFGFYDSAEKDMFLRLIGISGVGAKLAVTILSGMDLSELMASIARQDIKALSGVKGIGKKTAERIILELRDKIGQEFALTCEGASAAGITGVAEEAALALMALGFTRQEAESAVLKAGGEGMTAEQIIFKALKG